MAEKTVEELADDRSGVGRNPGGIDNSILAAAGGSGGVYTPPYAIDPYTSPYIQPRVVSFTINTYASLSRVGLLAKAFLDGIEIEDQTSSKGRITFTINEQRLLNPSTLTIVSGDLKAEKYFLIQCRKDAQNEVSVIEYDTIPEENKMIPAIPVISTPSFGGGFVDTRGGQYDGSGGGGGGMTSGINSIYETGFGREQLLQPAVNQVENLQ